MMDKKEDIERCLNCHYKDCTDVCPYSPYYRPNNSAKKRKKTKSPEKKKPKKNQFTSKQLTMAKSVAELYQLGWSMTGIAFKLKLTREEAVEAMRIAVKEKIYQ